MGEELIASQCCPTYFKATRVDNSCFRIAEAYIATDTFTSISDADRKYVRFGTDDEGDDICWEVDRTVSFSSPPANFTAITGLTAATDIVDSPDKILLESATQDSAIYVIVAACRKSDFDVILKGGSGADYFVNDATKLSNFKKRYGSSNSVAHGNICISPQQQFFAFDIRSTTTIDGSTNHANNFDGTPVGDASPIAVGRFIKVTGDLVDSSGTAAAVYKNTVGNNSQETSSNANSVTNEIFKVIDIKRQTRPDATNGPTYLKNISAYFKAGSTVTTLPADCSDCLQAYLQTESQSGYATATMDTIIPFATAGDTYINLFNLSPSLWPCRVNINRDYDISMAGAGVDGGIDKIRSRENEITQNTDSFEPLNCNEVGQLPSNSEEQKKSFNFGYSTDLSFNRLPFTRNIFEAHRDDSTASINKVTINTEYVKNVRMSTHNTTFVANDGSKVACGQFTTDVTLGSDINYDYILNSVSITTTYNTDSETGDIPEIAIFPTAESQTNLEPFAILPSYRDGQQQTCTLFESSCTLPGTTLTNFDITDLPIVHSKFEQTTPSIGLDTATKTYKGRIGMRTTNGLLIPMLRYAKFYCNNDGGLPSDSTANITSVYNEDLSRFNNIIDLAVPLAPQVELAAGFNVNGFKPSEQRTSTDRGRTDVVVDPGDGTKRCYPGKAHHAKFTFGDRASDGESITSIPFFMTTYAIGNATSDYLYKQGDAKAFAGSVSAMRAREAQYSCESGDDVEAKQTRKLSCDKDGQCNYTNDDNSPGTIDNCRDIHSLFAPHFMAHFLANNKYQKFDGTQTNIDFSKGDYLYAGNGEHYIDGALSGDQYEYVNDNGTPGTSTGGSRIGVDAEWSSVYIEAQDPYARGCTGCMRTVFSDDNYALLTDIPNRDQTENSNPHTI